MIGSSLLSLLDRLALEAFPEVGNVSTRDIGECTTILYLHNYGDLTSQYDCLAIQTTLVSADVEGYITTINSEKYISGAPKMSIAIPSELVKIFGGDGGTVRVIAAVTYNVEDLFPSGRPGMDK